ncbi:unnamed protein product [Ectocarpus sp. 8 AP-2014]
MYFYFREPLGRGLPCKHWTSPTIPICWSAPSSKPKNLDRRCPHVYSRTARLPQLSQKTPKPRNPQRQQQNKGTRPRSKIEADAQTPREAEQNYEQETNSIRHQRLDASILGPPDNI